MATPLASAWWPSTTAGNPALLTVLRRAWGISGQRLTLLGGVGCLALIGLMFWANLVHFVFIWWTDENYGHGFLVPLISLYFADQAARRGPIAVRSGIALGAGLLSLALAGKLATIIVPVGTVGDYSFLLALAGAFCLLWGQEALRRFWFAFFFLIFMIPLPVRLYAAIASPLQLLASQIAAGVLNGMGVPVLREGNLMTLPGGARIFVAEACSGMRQLTGFLALTAAVAYLTRKPGWYRAAVVAAALPVALTANTTRVILTGSIMHFANRDLALGTFHTAEGLLMMALGLVLLRGCCWILDLFEQVWAGPQNSAVTQGG
jgi:exosortase